MFGAGFRGKASVTLRPGFSRAASFNVISPCNVVRVVAPPSALPATVAGNEPPAASRVRASAGSSFNIRPAAPVVASDGEAAGSGWAAVVIAARSSCLGAVRQQGNSELLTSCAAGQCGARSSSGVWRRIDFATVGSRRIMPASGGVAPRNAFEARANAL